MDLELSDEQVLLSESIETLLTRAGDRVWDRLAEFGGLSIGGDDGLGAVELCLVSRALGADLAAVPYLGSAAVRLAVGEVPFERVAIAALEPGRSWGAGPRTVVAGDGVHGEKVAVEHPNEVDAFAVVADGALALVPAAAAAVTPRPSLDVTVPIGTVRFCGAEPAAVIEGSPERLMTAGALLAAAEAVGAAGRLLEDARRYAGERRQFGRTIGSYQALRHLLADMYVRQASSWSTVLYAAAALDEGLPDAAGTASVAKAYVSRAAREVAHGAMQVFGGIAFTAEHSAHRYLRRVIVREQQFGDADHHERALGRMLAGQVA
jgi:alkylation response protein AidB-like acyl-CoA dehydrogenase